MGALLRRGTVRMSRDLRHPGGTSHDRCRCGHCDLLGKRSAAALRIAMRNGPSSARVASSRWANDTFDSCSGSQKTHVGGV